MPEIEITIPTLHSGQAAIYKARTKRNAVRCGRRFGKTLMAITLAADTAIRGGKAGIYAPEYKQLQEPYDELRRCLAPLVAGSSKTDGVIKLKTGGKIDFWTLIDNELAGRGREYDRNILDEAAYTKTPQMMDIWQKSIIPTMATRPWAETWIMSTPNGNNVENFFFKACRDPALGFKEFWAPSEANPIVDRDWLEAERLKSHPDVFRQEYLAEFVDWSGTAFFALDKLLVDGRPVSYPRACDSVFLVIDTAIKGGSEHDATACSWWAHSTFGEHPLICLDWELLQVDGALLETVLPEWIDRGIRLARQCGARFGFGPAYIEDANAGTILLQQCTARGIDAEPLPSILTAKGKDGRALNASGPVYRGEVKLSDVAYGKSDVTFKGVTQNHMVSQITGYRLGDKNAAKRSDDLADTFMYAVAVALGNSEGFA